MRKSDKKIENNLRIALTDVCESALKEFTGFEWLTHLVKYSDFPKSLKIICVFDTNNNLTSFLNSNNRYDLEELIVKNLLCAEVRIKNITNHISYDTEEECEKNNNGKWGDRLS
jgi:predicted RNA-binding protein with PIN domain